VAFQNNNFGAMRMDSTIHIVCRLSRQRCYKDDIQSLEPILAASFTMPLEVRVFVEAGIGPRLEGLILVAVFYYAVFQQYQTSTRWI
jgi:hypothetical protein